MTRPGIQLRLLCFEMNLLSPIAAMYGAAVRLRRWGYAAGVLRTDRLQAPVISIGNLTMGGTGKTPTTIALGKRLLDSGHRVAILSRGYKGEHSGGPLLVSDGQCIHATAKEAGDEALVIARNLPRALVAVARKRRRQGRGWRSILEWMSIFWMMDFNICNCIVT